MYLYKLEHKKYNRENIRESVTSFEKSESEKVMRKVYEDACSKCIVSGF